MKIVLIGLLLLAACSYETEKVNIITGTAEVPKVKAPDCPNWTGSGTASRHESNFGCASRNNMGQMVKEPLDMVAGRGTNYYDGKKAAAAVSTYSAGGASSAAAASTGQ